MKIKMFIPLALILCLAFSLCACGTTANTDGTTTAPATTAASTEATTTAAATTAPATETEDNTAESNDTQTAFTEDDALELVKNTYELSGNNYYRPRGTFEVDGVTYFAVDLMKSLETNSTYNGLTYFVTTDGSEIVKGYIDNDEAFFTTGDEKPDFDVTEDNVVKVVEAAYDFEDGCFVTYRGVEEIDGVKYFAVDLRKSLEANTTYLSTYFVTETGAITLGYYEGGTPVLGE